MIHPQKILLAYDASSDSKEALQWAIDLSLLSRAPLVAVKVEESDLTHRSEAMFTEGYGTTLYERFVEMRQLDQEHLKEVVEAGKKKGVTIQTEMLYGHIATAILDYAKTNGVDLIVAGSRGQSALEQMLMGSVSQKLLSLSSIPVLVVKAKND
ncbi:MAG: universal stress protein [Veillonellaceae bacterium]|nr:universal stress protein [Veillonellaceae bacterium]